MGIYELGLRICKFAGALFLVASMAACSKPGQLGLGLGAGGANAGIGRSSVAAAPGSPQEFTAKIGDRVFFTTDSSELDGKARETLRRQAAWLARYRQYAAVIKGHSDERGTREYNLALGGRRAAAVRGFLIAQGVASRRVRTLSYGKERPVALCNDISCWSQNRRAITSLDARAGS